MCNATINKCKACHLREITEVTGNDADIKREFDRIEHNQQIHDLGDKLQALDYLKSKQAKTPSVGADGV